MFVMFILQSILEESLEFIKTATNIQTVTDGNTNESTQISNPNVEDFQPKIVDSEKGIMMQESVTIAKPVSFLWFLLLIVHFKLTCVNFDSKFIYEQFLFV